MNNFATIPNSIVRNKALSIQAKAVYAYLSSYAGKKGKCYPSYARMTTELNISQTSLTKYINELVECGYIHKEQSKANGKFNRNIYILDK
ncbi:MAG: helix-turn-helix domain-containing protein [Alphaproteobacteria bacterium]|nr:helix-turn-helix domain-containing protein [Alphaproteobacteria bacterium]